MLCEGARDDMGCHLPDLCYPRGVKTKGDDVGGYCPGFCHAWCKHHEILCSSQEDCNGCMSEEICRPKAKDYNGFYCPDDSASHDCPVKCDEAKGEVTCPIYEDVLGCKPKSACISRPKNSDGEFCPSHTVCEKRCQYDEFLCSDGYDSRGCKNADMCLPRGRDQDGNLCDSKCPPKCKEQEFICSGTLKGNGCRGESYCVEKKLDANGLECPQVCPTICNDREEIVGGDLDNRGCPTENSCVCKSYVLHVVFFPKAITFSNKSLHHALICVIILAKCPTVDVLHTNHWMDGDTGEYFYFSATDFGEMLGRSNWDGETFDVIQSGSQNWSGKVKVWEKSMWNGGPNGRRASGSQPGQWKPSDTIELQACHVAGSVLFIYIHTLTYIDNTILAQY